jgi:hypothetical protein
MKIKTKVSYYERQRTGKSPATYHATQPNGVGTTVHAKIKLDPSLKNRPSIRKLVVLHEKNEIKAWGQGKPKPHAVAKKATKRDNKFDSNSEYWRLIKRGR